MHTFLTITSIVLALGFTCVGGPAFLFVGLPVIGATCSLAGLAFCIYSIALQH